jgi:hypothetical protein
MQLPIGILIYWTKRIDENNSVISALWYYKELYVPSTIEEKKKSLHDLKEKRCTALSIHGKYEQIKDILSQGDRFIKAGNRELSEYFSLLADIEELPKDKTYLFDDVYHIKGTALMVDSMIEIDENMEYIQDALKNGKGVHVTISENWSFAGDLMKAFEGL